MAESKLRRLRAAFTLIEMLVSVAILSLILVVVASIADQTRRTWSFTNSKIEQFSGARTAFETVTRQLSQATLNSYWDYVNASGVARSSSNASTFIPASYARQSELRFVTGFTANLAAGLPQNSNPRPFHAVFFQAPLGYSEPMASTGVQLTGLDSLLNSLGYFVEFNSDTSYEPSFLGTVNTIKPRYRFRLMQFLEPANSFSVYSYTSGQPTYDKMQWFESAFGTPGATPDHILAENILALILLPKLSAEEDPTGASIAPAYAYDTANATDQTTINQLPPEVQLTLVAIDEASANRLAVLNGSNMPPVLSGSNLFTSASQYSADIQTVETTLTQQHINFRLFTTNAIIRAAKWSGTQQ
ncbi:MAG TPA: Verru_Chthon cassette protein C [Chthoniobacteraceae bacterium]|jgi:uncharacterized protein (TIGR02599 family)|nr:Verru_Chthon cassette protein C [Chthoniobacteraceae bacterium]